MPHDADKLDSIGAIGVGRAFACAGSHGSRLCARDERTGRRCCAGARRVYTPVHEYVHKLRRVLETLHTETARESSERHVFMQQFYSRLDAEMLGLA